MAILGIGLDLVDLSRIARVQARHGEAFVGRFCRPGEPQIRQGGAWIEHLGGLWAAKEAVLKALGTGWAQGLTLRQVEVVRGPGGAPSVRLHAAAAARLEEIGGTSVHLTITHERGHAAAVAIVEGSNG